jgi:hypothetical protein
VLVELLDEKYSLSPPIVLLYHNIFCINYQDLDVPSGRLGHGFELSGGTNLNFVERWIPFRQTLKKQNNIREMKLDTMLWLPRLTDKPKGVDRLRIPPTLIRT